MNILCLKLLKNNKLYGITYQGKCNYMKNIKDYNLDELKQEFIKLGEKAYRAEQVFKWLYVDKVYSFDDMTNISK